MRRSAETTAMQAEPGRPEPSDMGGLGTSADGTVSSTPDWLSDGTDGMGTDAELKPAEWFKHPIVVVGA